MPSLHFSCISSSPHLLGRRSRRGYVLLLTLLMIPIAAVALASIERLSMTRALEASRAEQELQRRWLATSCRAALLERAPAIMEKARLDGGDAVIDHAVTINAGHCQLELVFTDEQSKPNLNTLWSTRDPQQCEESLSRLMKDCPVPFVLRPAEPEQVVAGGTLFGTFGQVFGKAEPAVLLGFIDRTQSPAGRITLWGTGRLNFHSASQQALEEICAPVLGAGDIQKLLGIRNDQPSIGLVKLLAQMELTKEQRQDLLARLTDHSDCLAMWVVLTDSGGTWYSFAVGDGNGAIQLLEW